VIVAFPAETIGYVEGSKHDCELSFVVPWEKNHLESLSFHTALCSGKSKPGFPAFVLLRIGEHRRKKEPFP
jgi:hypothetical protein